MGNDHQIFQICHRDSEITELSLDFLCALCGKFSYPLFTSIVLPTRSVSCNTARCLGCSAVHPLHADQFPTAPTQPPARREQSARSCREVSCRSLAPPLRLRLRLHSARTWIF